jgi:hypothetical protein
VIVRHDQLRAHFVQCRCTPRLSFSGACRLRSCAPKPGTFSAT